MSDKINVEVVTPVEVIEISSTDFQRMTRAQFPELIDTWRVIPRLLVGAYSFLTWKVVDWYMNIGGTMEFCKIIKDEKVCGVFELTAPTTQQAALVTAVIGAAAVVFGLYTSSGKDWSKPIIPWIKK